MSAKELNWLAFKPGSYEYKLLSTCYNLAYSLKIAEHCTETDAKIFAYQETLKLLQEMQRHVPTLRP